MNVRDPLSRYAQIRKGLRIERLDCYSPSQHDWIARAVATRGASIPDQVALRIDIPAWFRKIARRTRRIARDMALGWSTSELATRYRLSASRISQIRGELYTSWMQFQGLDVSAHPV